MSSSQIASPLYEFRRDFRALARPGRRRYLAFGDKLEAGDIDAELRADDAKSYLSRLRWAIAWETQGKPWNAEHAAEIAAEVEAAAIGDAEVYAAEAETERRAIEAEAVVDKDAELETLRRIAADPNYLRPFGGGDGYARAMVDDHLHLYSTALQERWRDEAIATFLPIARAERGGKDDPSLDLRIDQLAYRFVRKFMDAKEAAAAEAEPEAKAEEAAAEPEADGPKAIWKPKAWCWQDPKSLPRLEALYGGHYYRGEVVSTVAPGGVGKSMLGIVEALAMITGKPLLGEFSRGGLRVMVMNYEDSELVLRHRVTAAMLHHRIRPEEIAGRLFVESMDSALMCFAKSKSKRDSVEIVEPSVYALVDAIRDNKIDVVIMDPWVSVHQVDSNLSHLVQPIVSAFKAIAQATNAAIEIVAHSRKPNGRELTEDDALGSVAFVNKTRDVRVLNKMTEPEAAKYGLAPWEAGDYFRVDTPKHTHRRSVRPVWRQKVSVSLGNKGPGMIDYATDVGVVAEWSPPTLASLIEGLEPEQIEAIKAAVAAGDDRESPQANAWAGNAVAKVLGLDVADKPQKAKAKSTLAALTKAGHFKSVDRPDPTGRGHTFKHLVPADPEDETEDENEE